jgi:hypothetical protein
MTKPARRAAEVKCSAEPRSRRAALQWLWLLAGACCVLPLCFNVLRGADLWWHLAAGRIIVSGHTIPSADAWTFTVAGRSWLDHEWLAQCIFYLWMRGFGLHALVLWFFGMLLLTAGVLQDGIQRWTGRPLVGLVCAVWAIAVAAPFFEIRPHLYTLFGLALLLRWILLLGAPDRWWLPLPFILWANLHAGVVLGLIVVGTWGLAWVLAGSDPEATWRRRLRRAGTVLAACIVAAAINPHGVQLLTYPLRVAWGARGTFRQLVEYLSPFARAGVRPALYPWAIGAFGAALLALALKGRVRAREVRLWAVLGTAGLTLAMSLVSARFVPLFAIAQAPVLAAAVTAMVPARGSRRSRRRSGAMRWALPVLAALAGLVVLQRFPLRLAVFRNLISEETFPVEVADFSERNHLRGNVFAYAGWGGYLHWRTNGRLRVYYDSRADTVFDPETYRRYVQVQFLLPGWIETLEASTAAYFLWPREPWAQLPNVGQARALMASGRWQLIHSDFASVLLARRGLDLPVTLADPPDSPYRRLALGVQAMERGEAREARRLLEGALAMDPLMLPACRNLVIVLAHTGQVTQAVAMGRRCNAIFPDEATEEALADELRRRRPAELPAAAGGT